MYIYFLVFFAIAFFSFAGNAGLFDPEPGVEKLQRISNSPHEINYIMQYFNKFFLFLLPAIIGASIYKDYKYKVHSILYSFPIRKLDYLLAKFLSSFLIVILISSSVGLAIIIAEHLPNLHTGKIGTFNILGYFQVYLVYTIPNILIFGAIIFATVAWIRNIYAGFAVIISLFFIQVITENAFFGYDLLVSIFDPFGQNPVTYNTQFWTLEERNTKMIPVLGAVLYNRLLWLTISMTFFIIAYHNFSFQEHVRGLFMPKKGKRAVKNNFESTVKVSLSEVRKNYSFNQQLKNVWQLSNTHFKSIVKNWMFLAISTLGVLAVIFTIAKVTNMDEMALLPTTKLMLQIPTFFFTGIIIITTWLYSGMLIHGERTYQVNQLVDTTSIPSWTLLVSKTLALIKMQAVLLIVMMMAGIIVQCYNGYYQFEIGLYIFHLFGLIFVKLIIWSFVSVLVQTLFTNMYLGIFIMLIGWIGTSGLPQIGINTKLLLFNSPPGLGFSDLNGYGNILGAYFLIEGYWFLFGAILLAVSYLFWVRGVPTSFRERLDLVASRFKGSVQVVFGLLFTAFLFTAFTIYMQESKSVLLQKKEQKKSFESFKAKYKKYEDIIQPRITTIKLAVDIYPEMNDFNVEGTYTLVNKSATKIDTLLVKKGFDEITHFDLNKKHAVISEDSYMQFSVLKLQKALLPNDSVEMSFSVKNKQNTLFERNSNVLNNGTFLGSDILPRLGYSFTTVKKHPLDSNATINSYAAIDADYIDFEATISTSTDQIAIAPGYLQREWVKNDRRYFEYKLDQEIKYVLNFNSGKFEILRDKWNDVELSIYYHKGHEYNLTKMMDGLKGALEYNSLHLGPYQHRNARIIEFPQTEGSYATTMANSIPTSEIRFIANTDDSENKVDQSFYVAAHELTHQWWGGQLTPADASGAVMLSESITEYFSLRIYEQQYGEEKALKFLKLQRQRYLKGRTKEQGVEPPLTLVNPEQSYLSYGKGSMMINALSHYLGEKKLNQVLKDFLQDYKFKEAPYATSLDLVKRIKTATPDSLQYVVNNMFEEVVFHENSVTDAKLTRLENGNYAIDFSLIVKKSMVEDGKKIALEPSDYLQIGVYDENEKQLQLQWYKISKVENNFTITLNKKPSKIVVDPNLLLIDKNIEDNTIELN